MPSPVPPRAGRRLRFAAGAALLLAGLPLTAAPPRGRVEPGFGVTPGGFVWVVEPVARRLVLRDLEGSERASFPLAADEGYVLGVADSGARVTAPTPDGLRRQPGRTGDERQVEARYTFRFPDGSVRSTARTSALRGSEPGFRGDEVFLVRMEEGRFRLVRVDPDGETTLGAIPEGEVRERVGRAAPPRVSAGGTSPSVLIPGARAEAAWRPGEAVALVVPDPLEACGEGRTRLVLPQAEGIVRVSIRTEPSADDETGGRPVAVAEHYDTTGRLLRSAPLGPWVEVFPLPDGGLLGLDGMEAARFDERFAEVSRTVLPLEEGADPDAAARVVAQLRRLDRLGPRASGADWAELALLPGAVASSHLALARDDPGGALDRLARVSDADPASPLAAKAVTLLGDLLDADGRLEFLAALRERVEHGGPVWLRRAAAFALLAGPGEAPSWALPSVAEAVASGTAEGAYSLPDEAFTLELAELVTAVDRARIERLAGERPDVAEALVAGSLDDAFSSSFSEFRFHAPARRFPRTLLSCASERPSLAGLLALTRIAEATLEAAPSPDEVARGRAEDGAASAVRGSLAATLLEARDSPDAELRAAALAVGPLAGLPLDADLFRAEVLRRPYLGALAVLGLVSDRSLTPRAWTGLFTELLLDARAASSAPASCAVSGWPVLQAEGEGNRDRYCNLFAIVHFAALDLGGEDDPAFISRERVALLADFARSSAAPPELRLELKLSRALRGTAPEEDVVEILGERDLASTFRRMVLGKVRAPAPRLAAMIERELGSTRIPRGERGAWLDSLARLDASAADRVAADAWVRGTVPLDGTDGEAGAFCRALALERVEGSERLRVALRRARTFPAARLEAATALAKAGDPASAAPLGAALLESCPACLPASELSALFGPLGEEGLEALERLAEETLPFGVSPLEALFELDAPRAGRLALERLRASLGRGCVPEPLLPALLGHGIDPFPELLTALEERGCDRARLRPGEPVAIGIARAWGTATGDAARHALASTPSEVCRRALASLLGIPHEGAAPPAPGEP